MIRDMKKFMIMIAMVLGFASCAKDEVSFIDMEAYKANAAWVDGSECNLTIAKGVCGSELTEVFDGEATVTCTELTGKSVCYEVGDVTLTFTTDIAYRLWAPGTCCTISGDNALWVVLDGSEITEDSGCIRLSAVTTNGTEFKVFEWGRVSITESIEITEFRDGGMVELNF